MYSYNKVEGEVFSKIINIKSFEDFLIYCEKFWKKKINIKPKKFFFIINVITFIMTKL